MCLNNCLLSQTGIAPANTTADLSDNCDIILNTCNYYDLSCLPKNVPNSLTICHWNIRSLLGKISNLRSILHNFEENDLFTDIISINETLLSADKLSLCNLNGYLLFENHRKIRKGGGVGIYVRDIHTVKHRTDLEIFLEGRFETVIIEVKNDQKKTLICSIYRPPNSSIVSFLKQIFRYES